MIYIAIDFDGTLVDHIFPEVGNPVPGAVEWVKKFKEAGAVLILWTMRCDGGDYDYLTDAINYCKANGLEFDYYNEHPQNWTTSPKVYAHRYIDDANACCPLKDNPRMGGRPFVDWDIVGPAIYDFIISQ